MLQSFTVWVNFIGLILAIWLGLYLVKRFARFPAAWLAALALWSTAGYFINQLLAIYLPAAPPPEVRYWIYHLILFWPRNVFEIGWQGWLQGWLPAYSLPFWYHATLYIRPGKFRWNRLTAALLGYAFTMAVILFKARYHVAWTNPVNSPYYSSSLTGIWLVLDAFGLIGFTGLSLLNLSKAVGASEHAMPRQYFHQILIATLAASVAGLLGVLSNWLGWPIPQAWAAALLSLALLLGWFGFVQYLALPDQILLFWDQLSSTRIAGLVLRIKQFSLSRTSQRLSLKLQQRYVQQNHQTNELEQALRHLADVTGAAWLVVLRSTRQGMQPAASWDWQGAPLEDVVADVQIDKFNGSSPAIPEVKPVPHIFQAADLFLPLQEPENGQIGVLLAGTPGGQSVFSPAQLNAFHDSIDFITGLVGESSDKSEPRTPKAGTFTSKAEEKAANKVEIKPRQIELALRNLHNFGFLADLSLAKLHLVENCTDHRENETNLFFNRGKAVSSVLTEAVFKLKPQQEDPPGPPPRSWYPFLILSRAYLEGIPNREIMSELYISEGTFNRTRREAIQTVTRILEEMESTLLEDA